MGEEEKKNNESPPADSGNPKEQTNVENAPSSLSTNLAPRTTGPEHHFDGTALEAMLGSQYNPNATVKIKNTAVSKPVHQRGVSWDLNVPNIEAIKPSNSAEAPLPLNRGVSLPAGNPAPTAARRPPIPRPPMVARNASKDSSVSSGHSPVRRRNDPRSPGNNPESQAAHFLNQVNADELQAETNLMRDLDEKDPLRPRAGTGASIFSQVPDDIEHNFIIEDEAGLVLPPARDRSNSRSREAPPKKLSDRKASKSPAPPKSHKRNMTLEQTLFGLTSALTEMKQNDKQERKHHDHQQGSMDSNDIFETAGMLFDRAHKKNVSSRDPVECKDDSHHSGGNRPTLQPQKSMKPSSRWGTVKANLDEIKKTDGDKSHSSDPVSHDIEEGIDENGEESDMEYSGDTHEESDDNPEETGGKKGRFHWMKKTKKAVNPFNKLPYASKVKEEWDVFNKFLNPRKQSLRMYVKIILMYIMIPATGVAGILFYLAGNPPYGTCDPVTGCVPRKEYPSASWWILFIGCRQIVIACLAKLTEAFVIDFLALRTQFTLRLFGPMVTLLLVQARGWPFLLVGFGMYNFALCVGDSPFSNHWLFWQPYVGMFNRANPPGFVTSSLAFYRVCAVAMGVGAAVAVKRMAVGIYLGRKTFANYSKSLTSVMNKMLMLNELARFGRALEDQNLYSSRKNYGRSSQLADERLSELLDLAQADDDDLTFSRGKSMRSGSDNERSEVDEMDKVIDETDRDPYTGGLSTRQKQRICDLLGQWEEPQRHSNSVADEVASVGAVMQFKRALAHMDTDFPFGGGFGVADTREACIQCSQQLYDRLLLRENGITGMLHFNTVALIAMDRNSNLDSEKTKDLIRMFRPDRDGTISMVDFVKAVDNVYKELRLLRATVAGSTKIDRALESIFNYLFYVVLACVILWILNIDPLALFLSLSSIVLAFAFMIGSASAKYFEGVLLILVQRPYGIGDRVNISNPEVPSDAAGSQGWIVEDVTLFTTTLCLAATSERATIANGMLAKSRIINGARSPNAIVYVVMRFGIETPYHKIETFKVAIEKFVRSKPREWSAMLGFRVSRIEADLGFIEYTTVLRHREGWQNILPILNSRNTMHAFCIELAKKLNMRYKNPPLPVELQMHGQMPPQFDLKFDNEELAGEKGYGRSDPTHSPGAQSYTSESIAKLAAMFDD